MISEVGHGSRGRVEVLDFWTFDAAQFTHYHLKGPDVEAHHNHPFEWCWAQTLNGEYTHEFFYVVDGLAGPLQSRTFRPGEINWIPGNMFHKITAVAPDTHALFFFGPPIPRALEYWTNGKALKSSEYLASL
jgi:hypothetical protein